MANKIIPELPEIDLVDVELTHLTVLDTGLETFKLRLETLLELFLEQIVFPDFPVTRVKFSVVFNGITTGDKDVTVSSLVSDARNWQWMLKKPEGGSTLGEQILLTIKTVDAATVRLATGDFALDAGTYTLIGVGGD